MSKMILLFIPLLLTINQFNIISTADTNHDLEKPASKTLKFLALGDSYTIGEGVLESDRWPVVLQQRLKKDGINISSPEIVATTGWTTFELQDAIDKKNIRETYDLVSLLIGVNNQYRGLSINDYRQEFGELLKMATHFAGEDPGKVIVLSIPDYGVTPFAANRDPDKISREVAEFNQVQKKICESAGIKFFNITPLSLKAKSDHSLLAEDKLHPSGKMYREWVELIYHEIKSLFFN